MTVRLVLEGRSMYSAGRRWRLATLAAVSLGCSQPARVTKPAPQSEPSSVANPAGPGDTTKPTPPGAGATSVPLADPFPSTYKPVASRPTYISNVTILTAAGPTIQRGAVLLRDGKIVGVGTAAMDVPADAVRIDGTGKYLTPGIIDVH